MSDAPDEEFRRLFEQTVPQILRPLVRYVRGDERVTDVWVYVTMQDGVSSESAVYRVADEFLPLEDCTTLFGNPESAILALSESLDPLFFDIQDRSQLPNSMVVHYNLKTQEMDTKFSHERISFQGDESDSSHAARWAREFRG